MTRPVPRRDHHRQMGRAGRFHASATDLEHRLRAVGGKKVRDASTRTGPTRGAGRIVVRHRASERFESPGRQRPGGQTHQGRPPRPAPAPRNGANGHRAAAGLPEAALVRWLVRCSSGARASASRALMIRAVFSRAAGNPDDVSDQDRDQRRRSPTPGPAEAGRVDVEDRSPACAAILAMTPPPGVRQVRDSNDDHQQGARDGGTFVAAPG